MKIKSLEDQTLVSRGGEVLFTLPVTAQEFQRNLLVRIIDNPEELEKAVKRIIAGRVLPEASWTVPAGIGSSFIHGAKILHETVYGMIPAFYVPVYPVRPALTSEEYIARIYSNQMGVIAG